MLTRSAKRARCFFFCLFVCLNCVYFPRGTGVKSSPASAGDERNLGLIPKPETYPGGGNDNLLQQLCLGNPMNERAL